ncbi:hypothetical protein Hanom_Chr02g00108311 [Helianthus anomalus]
MNRVINLLITIAGNPVSKISSTRVFESENIRQQQNTSSIVVLDSSEQISSNTIRSLTY